MIYSLKQLKAVKRWFKKVSYKWETKSSKLNENTAYLTLNQMCIFRILTESLSNTNKEKLAEF